jgi:hypothetical protein
MNYIPEPWVLDSIDSDGYKIRPATGGLIVAIVKNQDSQAAGIAQRNARVVAMAPSLLDFVMSLENDNNCIPPFMWEWRNRLVSAARGEA